MTLTELVQRKVADLIPYDHKSRTHSEAQIAQIAASINELGFTNPVLIDEQNTIIAGYGRVLAAKTLKMTTVPCVVLTGLTDAQLKSGLPAGFDPAVWGQSAGINNGYPYLLSNPPPQ